MNLSSAILPIYLFRNGEFRRSPFQDLEDITAYHAHPDQALLGEGDRVRCSYEIIHLKQGVIRMIY